MRAVVSRELGAEREVSPLELFFDLVYVFAIGELSHHLAVQLGVRTGVETLILAVAVYYAWSMTARGRTGWRRITSRCGWCWSRSRSRACSCQGRSATHSPAAPGCSSPVIRCSRLGARDS